MAGLLFATLYCLMAFVQFFHDKKCGAYSACLKSETRNLKTEHQAKMAIAIFVIHSFLIKN